jgi:hypothetical protein
MLLVRKPNKKSVELNCFEKMKGQKVDFYPLKVHKIENFFDSDFGICDISLLVMSKYLNFNKKMF